MSIIYNSESKWQRNIVQRCATSCRTILFYPALFQIYTSTMHCVCFVLLWLWPSAFTHSLGVASVWRTMTLDPKYLAFAVSRILHETKQAQRLQNIWSIENLLSHFPIPPLFWWSNNATSLAICKLYLKFNSWKKSRNQKKRRSLSDCSVKFGKGETKSISRFPPRFLFQCFQRHTKYFLVLLNQSFEILLYCCKCHLIFELMMMVMAQQWYLRWMCVE